jgi:hypothetical protein
VMLPWFYWLRRLVFNLSGWLSRTRDCHTRRFILFSWNLCSWLSRSEIFAADCQMNLSQVKAILCYWDLSDRLESWTKIVTEWINSYWGLCDWLFPMEIVQPWLTFLKPLCVEIFPLIALWTSSLSEVVGLGEGYGT